MDVRVHKEGWAAKSLFFQTVELEKTFESPLGSKKIKPVNLKGNQLWILNRRINAEAETLGHLMWTADSLEKSLMLGKIEGIRKRGCQKIRWLDDITNAMDRKLGTFWEMLRDREVWCANWVTEQQQSLCEIIVTDHRNIYFYHHSCFCSTKKEWFP